MKRRLWPRSLRGQMLLAVALALLLAQGISSMLIYRGQAERREIGLIHSAAFRLLRASRTGVAALPERFGEGRGRGLWIEQVRQSPLRSGEWRDRHAEAGLRGILADQDFAVSEVVVVHRRVVADPFARDRVARHARMLGDHSGPRPSHLIVAGVRLAGGDWLVARVLVPPGERMFVASLIAQTLIIYIVMVVAIALILRRIARPLATLTERVERFAATRDPADQLLPEGPDDIRRLIVAHNRMEGRIAALLDEKDVMLGAIGHDLKTPLSALRVRIESVDDDVQRGRMAATIEDIVRSLDDILALARAGHAREPQEMSELSALVASIVEEYEDREMPVTLESECRIVLPLRATWVRRALRNLIDNALRYGKTARVSLTTEGNFAVCRVDDDGPGIAEADLPRMLEPFTRGEPSRNTETGGAGLGLALAKAIAEQQGGRLSLGNRRGPGETVAGLSAALYLPLR